jgi:hypothetical protein
MGKIYNPKTQELVKEHKIGKDKCILCGKVPTYKELNGTINKNNFKLHGLCDSCYKEVYGGK